MKPALVLGLALAANAFSADQYDNELIVAPTDQFGNIKKYPGNIRFDEQADDELLIRPVFAQVADDELLVRPLSTHVADDELIIAPTDEFGRIKHYPPYIKFDEDGNEFFVAPTHRLGDIGHRILYDDELAAHASNVKELLERQFEYRRRLDDEADTELMMAPYRVFDDLITRKVYDDEADTELMRAPYQKRRHDDIEGRRGYDDEADTELMMAPLDGTGKYNRRRFDDVVTRKVYDDEADSELMVSPFRRKFDDLEGRKVYDDELLVREMRPIHHQAVDDELLVRPNRHYQAVDDELIIAPTDEFVRFKKLPRYVMYDEVDDELLAKTDVQRHQSGTRGVGTRLFIDRQAEALRRRDDEELFKRPVSSSEPHHPSAPTMKPKLFIQRQAEALRRDDEGDDELAYLGELIKLHKKDRFRDHELPEIKTRKPLNGGFLPVN